MTSIKRLLVANRGEIASRVISSAHELGMKTVAVYAEGDAGAPYLEEASTAIALAGRSATETYLDIGAILEAARLAGADAVHPGYGFLSESAAFARAVREAGLVFVGPPSEVIEALGDKIRAKAIMREAGVPVLDSLEVAPGAVLDHRSVSYPAMVKAAAGGGGKGMRVVREPFELDDALAAAAREAAAAFGDPRLFVEPYLERARHVEIQIFGDTEGNLVHCFERECSIQRRHQKVIEEAPSPAVSAELREEMGAAALRAASAVGYESAGTVEFLLGEDGRYFFLEVNTRLQVEHRVTEAVTGLDLVREQLRVAEGSPLSFSRDDLAISGHAIEARLYAEDPESGFLPSTGRIELWRPAPSPAVLYDSGIKTGFVVGIEFDPMLAKVVAHAPTRTEAASRLALALERTAVHGPATNRDFLVGVLRSEKFLAGETTTHFLSEVEIAPRLALGERELAFAAIAAALYEEESERTGAGVLASLPSGWRMSAMPPQLRRYRHGEATLGVSYRRDRDGSFGVEVTLDAKPEGSSHRVVRHHGPSERPTVEIDGVRPNLAVTRADRRLWVDFETGEQVELTALDRFPEPEQTLSEGDLVAPMPGRVLSVHVAAGDEVAAGQLLVVVEAMKMEHRISAPSPGRVRELSVDAGTQVAGGDLLVALETDGDEGGH